MREAMLLVTGVVLGAFVASLVPDSSEARAPSSTRQDPKAIRFEPAPSKRLRVASTSTKPAADRFDREVLRLRSRVSALERQRQDLQAQLSEVEQELDEALGPPEYEFSPTVEQWRVMAANSEIKYRVPCPEGGLRLGSNFLDSMGLSPNDETTITEAFERSRHRLWNVVRFACLDFVQNEAAIDLMGVRGCRTILESAATAKNPTAMADARRQVAEVRGELRDPLQAEDGPTALYSLYFALTGEGEQFEQELAESFGPELAEHVWHSFPCTDSMGSRLLRPAR